MHVRRLQLEVLLISKDVQVAELMNGRARPDHLVSISCCTSSESAVYVVRVLRNKTLRCTCTCWNCVLSHWSDHTVELQRS